MMSKFFNFLIVWFFIVVTSGCNQQSQENGQEVVQTQPEHVGYLRIPFNWPVTTIDPGLTKDLAHIEVVEQLFLGLTDFDPKTYEVLPELATGWEVSDDGMVYTFKLRQDVKWTRGEPVTAHDIVWAIRRNVAPKTNSPNAYTLYTLKNAEAIHRGKPVDVSGVYTLDDYGEPATKQSVDVQIPSDVLPLGVRAIDDYTVEFTLEHPAGYFPALASMWTYRPLPRHVIEQYGDDWTEPEYIQTNGSYVLAEWNKGSQLILKKNPYYYDAKSVNISEVHYYIVPESTLGLAMYEQNELDIIGGQVYLNLPPEDIPRIKQDPILRKERQMSPHFCTEWYGFNTRRFPMDNPLVRKAISAAIDKQTLIDIVVQGNHLTATTFTRPPIFGSVDPSEEVGIQFNPKQAKAWLAEAGYPEGKGFPQVILMYNFDETRSNIAKGIKTILKHYLNIDIEVRALDYDRYLDIIYQPTTPHIFRMGWCADYPDANNWLHEVFHPDKGINWIGWKNQEFAEVVDKAQRISDQMVRKQLYYRAEQILTEEEAAIIPLYFSSAQFLVKPWVKGWYNMAFGGQHIRNWSLEN
ncbi:peptide ABC transporter substrate-binding protein [Candidatus Parabeggiatoa sp. HSG14]|uniref:peptide ABC transporter substrate-binding protein n=1 Tax=Candidatus Parabeggiatoa sp. HSG14 TaxID=3055593 RepID=UPI0025A8B48F|nr:peptide ABC transporter substrate-binding protein [Thiotrichales bacterium HSG14]